MKIRTILISLILFTFLTGCQRSIESQAIGLLRKYDLKPVGGAIESNEEKQKIINAKQINIEELNRLISEVGFSDIQRYRSVNQDVLIYLLKQRSNGNDGRIFALFLYAVDEKKIVGALLYSPDWSIGFSSLNDKKGFQTDD